MPISVHGFLHSHDFQASFFPFLLISSSPRYRSWFLFFLIYPCIFLFCFFFCLSNCVEMFMHGFLIARSLALWLRLLAASAFSSFITRCSLCRLLEFVFHKTLGKSRIMQRLILLYVYFIFSLYNSLDFLSFSSYWTAIFFWTFSLNYNFFFSTLLSPFLSSLQTGSVGMFVKLVDADCPRSTSLPAAAGAAAATASRRDIQPRETITLQAPEETAAQHRWVCYLLIAMSLRRSFLILSPNMWIIVDRLQ